MSNMYESKERDQVIKYAKDRGYVLNKGLAIYLLYGETPESEWETPLPRWVKDLPDGPPLQDIE